MNTKTEFLRIMAEQTEMALATSVNNIPNVRIINFYFDPCDNILYFSTFKDNNKVKEIEENPSIAFTTIPHTGNQHVIAKGLAKRSLKTIFDLEAQFIAKVPDYKKTIDFAGESLILFEVKFDTAIVTKDLATISTLKL
ncbi:MAG: pyridoxamine 5'-phosphate oxidase family protein [Streptococcus salivarius]|nr:pyridoxamine 5'-phosphate oxidase family protein [Streptococcus salivarius]